MTDSNFIFKPFSAERLGWARQKIIEAWGAEYIVAHGELFYPLKLPGFIAELRSNPVGLITYHLTEKECEVITLNSWHPGFGIGSALLEKVGWEARQSGSRRLFLVTTDNNFLALRFYQKRGFSIITIRKNAIEENRRIKPEIPFFDDNGIPIRDEVELEILLK